MYSGLRKVTKTPMISLKKHLFTGLSAFALTCAMLPLAASAQTPSYAAPGPQTIKGTVASINGKYNISVRDDRGYVDNVTLHQGTIINPTGLTLAPGEQVTIEGTNAGSTFVANEIDTPYVYYAYPYPYPAYSYAYPAFGLGLRFGGPHFGIGFHGRA